MKQLTLILTLIPIILFGQGWERDLTHGYGNSVKQTSDGGYIVTGKKTWEDVVCLIRTTESGNTLWIKTYELSIFGPCSGNSVEQTVDGNFIITGTYVSGPNEEEVFLMKVDENGNTLWTRNYGNIGPDKGWSVKQTSDSGYIVTGATKTYENADDVYLFKTDENGNLLWSRTYGKDYDDIGYSVQQTMDGGYIITGAIGTGFSNSEFKTDIYLIKTDSNGDTLWTKTFGGQDKDVGSSVRQTTDSGYILVGWIESPSTHSDIYLIKTNSEGDTLWTKTYVGPRNDYGFSVRQTLDGGYIIAGAFDPETRDSNPDVYLIKTNNSGDTLWTQSYGGPGGDGGYCIEQTTDGGYIITGVNSVYPGTRVYLIKTDGLGIVSTFEIPITNQNRKLIKIIDLQGREMSKPQKNIPFIEIYDNGTTQKKIIIK